MTISNETKVGALSIVAVVFLFLGFNFLKGKSLGGNATQYAAFFSNVQGLAKGNPVVVNGKEVGSIYSTDFTSDMKQIKAVINIKEPITIPDDSYAIITKSLLGVVQLDINLGQSATLLKKGATIKTAPSGDLVGDAMKKLDPVLNQVNGAVKSLDTFINNANSVFDLNTKNNIRAVMENLNRTTASLAVSAASLQQMLNQQTGTIAKTVGNLNAFTSNLKDNNGKISQTMSNMENATEKFANLNIDKTLTTLDQSVNQIKDIIGKINSDKGTLGLLMNDTRLYNNLTATSNKINLLIDDLRVNPKRYVSFSVFGKKAKGESLTVPQPDTLNAPYLKK